MKCLSEPIAKRGNREEEVTGHFWEARYKIQPLLDEMVIAACMAYVDLNPIRAGIALTPETSDFTSVQERILDRHSAVNIGDTLQYPSSDLSATFSPDSGEKGDHGDAQDHKIEHGANAGWLAPVTLDPPRKKVREAQSSRRASNKGCLPMTLDEYLKLLDWTGRQLRNDKAGRIPSEFGPILERLDCSAESWLDLVQNFRKRFRTEAGRPATLQNASSLRRTRRHANSSSKQSCAWHASHGCPRQAARSIVVTDCIHSSRSFVARSVALMSPARSPKVKPTNAPFWLAPLKQIAVI